MKSQTNDFRGIPSFLILRDIETEIPTMTATFMPSETAEPRFTPTSTPVPSATMMPTNSPTATQVPPESTPEVLVEKIDY